MGVPVPCLYYMELETGSLYMERLPGTSLKAALQQGLLDAPATARALADVGRLVAVLHDGGLIHGDLTTSNVLMSSSEDGRAAGAGASVVRGTPGGDGDWGV